MSVKKRLIFEILFDSGYVCISRNFRLQKMGTVDWFKKAFNIFEVTKFIDEITVINLTDSIMFDKEFNQFVEWIACNCFAPMTLGGNLKNSIDAKKYLDFGADKVIVNSNFFGNIEKISEIVDTFGQQFIVISLDYRKQGNSILIYTNRGSNKIHDLEMIPIDQINEFAGEVVLRSIGNDGTGNGFDLDLMKILTPMK